MRKPNNKKKVSLEESVDRLALIAEKHLSKMPQEEQEERVSAMSRRVFTSRRGNPSTPARSEYTPECRVSARGRE